MFPFRSNFTLANPAVVTATDDTDAATYFAAMTTAPSAAERARVNTLVRGLKTDGVWTTLDWLLLFAAETQQAALLNAKNTAKSATPQNFPTFTANRGFLGDGSGAFIDLGEVWQATGNQFTSNSGTAGAWCNAEGSAGLKPLFGNTANSSRTAILARAATGTESFRFNDNVDDTFQASPGTRMGHRTGTRASSTVKRGFYNGTRVADITATATAVNTTNACALRSGSTYSDDRLAVLYSGAGWSDALATAMHNRLYAYLNDKGAA